VICFPPAVCANPSSGSSVFLLTQSSCIKTSHEDLATLKQELYAAQCERKQALVDKEAQLQEAYNARKAHDIAMETIEQTSREVDALRAKVENLKQELKETKKEADAATK